MAHGSERKMEMKLKETIDEYITVFEKTERAKIQAMLDAVDCGETTKLYGLQADLSFTQGCLYMLRTIKEKTKDEKLRSREEIIQRLEEARAEKERSEEEARQAIIATDAEMYTEMASELCSEISALEWVLER
mgnify:CR=1 FL=1